MLTSRTRGVLATAGFLLFTGPALAGEGAASGSWTAQITKQEARPLGSPDHLLVSQVAHGISKTAAPSTKFEGAHVLLSETLELEKGNGPQRGLFSLVDAKGSKTTEYTGRITTTMVEGQPRTTGKGTWKFVSGTGSYADARDTGTYSFTMTSATELAGEWKEDERSASR